MGLEDNLAFKVDNEVACLAVEELLGVVDEVLIDRKCLRDKHR